MSFDKVDVGGAIPPNVLKEAIAEDLLKFGNNAANDPYTSRCKEAKVRIHPATPALPEFFLMLLTSEAHMYRSVRGLQPDGTVAKLEPRMIQECLYASKVRVEQIV